MEMNEKLEFIDILKVSADIFRGNVGFISYAFISSLPLFCFSVFFELCLQNIFSFVFGFIYQQYYSWGVVSPEEFPRPTAFISKLLQIYLLYLFPYHLLDLLTTTAVVDAASSVYTSEIQIGFRDLLRKSAHTSRKFTGCLVTSLFVLLFSATALLGFIWIVTDYIFFSPFALFGRYYYLHLYDSQIDLLIQLALLLLHGALFIVLTVKYVKWSAGWNMGLVVSALEDPSVYGSDALALSVYYCRGNETRGQRLMLVFFAYGLVLRMPCLFSKCRVLYTCVYVGLICLGNVFKWVACVVYYFDCRGRVLEKKADEETGRRSKSVAT